MVKYHDPIDGADNALGYLKSNSGRYPDCKKISVACDRLDFNLPSFEETLKSRPKPIQVLYEKIKGLQSGDVDEKDNRETIELLIEFCELQKKLA